MLRTVSLAALSLLLVTPALAQSGGLDLPLTFDETIDYELFGFAGADQSAIVTDPEDPTNNVVRVIRDAQAQTFAGTVIADGGLDNPIPFAPDATTMSVRVWTPEAGTPVVLKVEQSGVGAIAVESQPVLSTVGGMYETLVFDFADEAATRLALDFDATYNKLVVFFDFGMAGAGGPYYFDDIAFGDGEGGGMGNDSSSPASLTGRLTGGAPEVVELYVVNDIDGPQRRRRTAPFLQWRRHRRRRVRPRLVGLGGDYLHVTDDSTQFHDICGFAPDSTFPV